jgi:hypothetical protein
MFLVLDKDTTHVETLTFNLTITNGEITGDVITSQPRRMSGVRGRCQPATLLPTLPGLPVIANMNFIFRLRRRGVERGVHLAGIALFPTLGNPIFEGSLLVFDPDNFVPPGGDGEAQDISGDPGDTGTGTGTQT